MIKKPEILAPAGDFEKLQFAVAYGADAVYFAGNSFGMRASADNIAAENISSAVDYCHARKVRAFVTVNTMPRCDEIEKLPEYLELLEACKVDAMIIADLGVLAMAKKYAPHVACHISTQASIVNHASAQAYYDMGAARVVLGRELSLDEIITIRAKTPKALELETFVHGAMCMSYSGRCMLSNFLTGRDANRGACAQPCRWKYSVVEEKRPDAPMKLYEDENGTYIFNSKDLCMLEHLPELVNAGINSFKIEGRAKTAYYAAVVTNAYRRALDAFYDGQKDINPDFLQELSKVSHREYCTGFYYGRSDIQHRADSDYIREWDVCATVQRIDEQGNAHILQKNRFMQGDELELLSAGQAAQTFILAEMEDEGYNKVSDASRPHQRLVVKLPQGAAPFSILRKKIR